MRRLSHDEMARNRLTIEQLRNEPRHPLFVLTDNVRSLYNVGSIFRTSDGARIEKLILCGYTPHPPRREIEKTALGTTQSVPWEYIKDPRRAIDMLKGAGIRICALEHTDSSVPYHKLRRESFPICLILGNEITGVSKELIEQADCAIHIPMFGTKQSLNVAVAYGIAAFGLVQIWKGQE